MSLLLQELFSANVEASGSRIHIDGRANARRRDLENPWPIVDVPRGVLGIVRQKHVGAGIRCYMAVKMGYEADVCHSPFVHPRHKANASTSADVPNWTFP
jgi:hypothetical protein